jgi:hypothetical protein
MHVQLNGTNLSADTIEDAIQSLASYDEALRPPREDLSKWLRTLIVSFVESSRLTAVSAAVAEAIRIPGIRQIELSDNHIWLIHNWGSLSTAVVQAANNVVVNPDSNIFREFGFIRTAQQATPVLGLVLLVSKASSRKKAGRIMVHDNDDDVALGMTLLEVVSVVIRQYRRRRPRRSLRYGPRPRLIWPRQSTPGQHPVSQARRQGRA